jgi:hypothetical protein
MRIDSIASLSFLTTALGAVSFTAAQAADLTQPADPAAVPTAPVQQRLAPATQQQLPTVAPSGAAISPTAPNKSAFTFQVSEAALLNPVPASFSQPAEAELISAPVLRGVGSSIVGGQKAAPQQAQAGQRRSPANASKVAKPGKNSAAAKPPPAIAQAASVNLAQATSGGVQILRPTASITSEKFTDLVVQYPTGATVTVKLNNAPLDASKLQTQTQPGADSSQTVQSWYGVPLKPGDNTITVQAGDAAPATISIKVQETAAKIEFAPFKESRIPADGRSLLLLEGQVLDNSGQAVQKDVVVTLTASVGKFIGADYDKDRPGFQVKARQGRFRAELKSPLEPQTVRVRAAVDRWQLVTEAEKQKPTITPYPEVKRPAYQGSPNLDTARPDYQLAPTLSKELEAYTQAEFITNLRPFILSGQVNLRFGQAGLDFYNSYESFLRPSLLDQGYRVDFSTAVFASGRIGDWLFTGALNNQRALNKDCSGATRLFKADQFCDQVYPVYGDSSTVDYLTPSIDSVYFKIERTSPVVGAGSDYAMWGDYTTPEFSRSSQFYTASTRQLHGFKANYNLGDLQLTFAYANNVRGFQRDSIAPNGTSGYYFLSRRLVIAGSENLFLETEELNRPGTVIERKPLYRVTDYEIDYDRGTVLFRRAVNQLEFDAFGRTLVRKIVATYQFDGDGDGGKYYAGRLQYNFSREIGRETYAGFTYQREDQGDQRFELYGGDALVSLGKDIQFTAEIARSNFDSVFQGEIDGYAYRFELLGTLFPGVYGRAYYRSVEEGFTNNATASFAPGQTRYGAEVSARVTPTTQALINFDREVNFGIAPAARGLTAIARVGFGDLFNPTQEPIPGTRVDNSQTTFRAGVLQKLGPVELGLDYVRRSRQDRIVPQALNMDSNQFIARLNYAITKEFLFRVQTERNLTRSSSNIDPIYPNRTTVGLDWAVSPDVTLRVAQQFVEQTRQYRANSFTSFDILSDKRLSDDTTFTSRYSVINGINGWSSQAAMGLNHRIKLAPGLRMTLGYERIAGDLFLYTGAGQQFAQPVASGQSSASLGLAAADSYSVGVDYTDNPNFKANARFEYRDAKDSNDTMVISAAAAGKLSPSLTLLARYQQADYQNQLITDAGLGETMNVKFGLAYRNPFDDKFNALLRYEFRKNPALTPDTILVGTGTGSNIHVVSLEAIYAPNWRWEFYGKFALRDTKSYLAKDLLGTNAISLGQFRALYRLGYRFDIGGEVRWVSQSVVGFDEVGFAIEAGYYLTPNLRFALGYNFGRAQDRDLDRQKDGIYVNLSLKLDQLLQGFGVKLPDRQVAPKQQQESVVKPLAASENPSPSAILSPPATADGAIAEPALVAPVSQPALSQPALNQPTVNQPTEVSLPAGEGNPQ